MLCMSLFAEIRLPEDADHAVRLLVIVLRLSTMVLFLSLCVLALLLFFKALSCLFCFLFDFFATERCFFSQPSVCCPFAEGTSTQKKSIESQEGCRPGS